MKAKILLIATFFSLANFAHADKGLFSKDRCPQIKSTIEKLMLTSDGQWIKLLANPSDKEVALELSWTMNLAQNYSNIYSVFCTKN